MRTSDRPPGQQYGGVADYSEPTYSTHTPPAGRPALLLLVALVALAVGLSGLLAVSGAAGGGEDARIDDGRPPREPMLMPLDVLSARGYAEMVAAVRTTTGSTQATEALIYPDYAVLHLPGRDASGPQTSWYWDGRLDELEAEGKPADERFALDRVDPDVLLRLVRRAQEFIGTPTSYYVIVRAPDADGAAIWAHARNEFLEAGYISATLSGDVVRNTFVE